MKEIADLEQRIGQRRKFIRTETAEGRRETAQKIRAEIEALQEELSVARVGARIDLDQHRQSTHYLEKLDPEEMHQA